MSEERLMSAGTLEVYGCHVPEIMEAKLAEQ